MIEYFPRVVDGQLDRRLASSGAVLIEGPLLEHLPLEGSLTTI